MVTLTKVWPMDKATGKLITDQDKIGIMGYEDTLKRSCNRFNGNFVSYNAVTGMWTFEVNIQIQQFQKTKKLNDFKF